MEKSMDLTLRFRAYLPDDVASAAWRHIDILRQLRNHAVRDYYDADYNDKPSDYDQHEKFSEWKQHWPVFSEPSAHAAQQAISQIHDDLDGLDAKRDNGYDVGRLRQLGAGRSESTPVQTALPTFIPQRGAVDAKRVVEAGSPEA